MLLEGATSITGPLANRGLTFDYGAMPICAQITAAPYVLGIKAGFPGDDLRAYLAEARRRPGEVTFGTPGVAHIAHLMGEMLQSLADVRLEHVPFRGGADAAREVSGGRIDSCIISESSFSPVLRNLPGVPTIGELVPGYELWTWMMIFSPPGTPMPIRQRLSQAFAAAVTDPRLRGRIEESGNDPVSAGPEQAENLWRQEREKVTGLMRRAGLAQG